MTLFETTVDVILNNAWGVATDEDGIDDEQKIAAFNIGYQLFIDGYDKAFPGRRLRTLNFTSASTGTTIEDLDEDLDGNVTTALFYPYDVTQYDDSGDEIVYYDKMPEVRDAFDVNHYGWRIERQSDGTHKIFFYGVDHPAKFKVRYVPIFQLLPTDADPSSYTVLFHPKAMPFFAQYLVSMYSIIEDEDWQKAVQAAPLIFGQYFNGMIEAMNDSGPGEMYFYGGDTETASIGFSI